MQQMCCSGCCGSFLRKIQDIFKDNVKELKTLLWYAVPLIITNLLRSGPLIITTIFCGHLGKTELDANALAVSFTSITGLSIGTGLSSAFDTLISQLYGAKNLKMIGVVTQRGIIILSLTCFPCWALYVNSRSILLLCGQDPKVARLAEWCVFIQIPSLPALFYHGIAQRFLQNQGIIWPQVVICLIMNIFTIIFTYVMIFVFKIGVLGAAISYSVSFILGMIMLLLYIWLKKLYVETWSGWSYECLKDWKSFMSLGIPNLFILVIDWWSYEISVFLTGLINLVELGGQSILYQLMVLMHKIANSIGLAANIKVGNALGAGETDQAKKFAKLSFVIIACSTLLNITLLVGLRSPIAHIFTSDKDILSLVIHAISICAIFHVFEGASSVFSGILRGIGKPEIGAIAFTLGYCLIAYPVGTILMFVVKLGLKGYWIGVTSCLLCINIFFLIYFWRLNWQDMTEKTQERVRLKQTHTKIIPFDDNTIAPPADTLELKNYASMESTYCKTEPHQRTAAEFSEKTEDPSMKKLIICRVLEATAVISIFFIGLVIRFTVKHS